MSVYNLFKPSMTASLQLVWTLKTHSVRLACCRHRVARPITRLAKHVDAASLKGDQTSIRTRNVTVLPKAFHGTYLPQMTLTVKERKKETKRTNVSLGETQLEFICQFVVTESGRC